MLNYLKTFSTCYQRKYRITSTSNKCETRIARVKLFLSRRWFAIIQIQNALYIIRAWITNLQCITNRCLPYPSHTTVPGRVLLSLVSVSVAARLATVAVPVVAVAANRSVIYRIQPNPIVVSTVSNCWPVGYSTTIISGPYVIIPLIIIR